MSLSDRLCDLLQQYSVVSGMALTFRLDYLINTKLVINFSNKISPFDIKFYAYISVESEILRRISRQTRNEARLNRSTSKHQYRTTHHTLANMAETYP